MKNEEQNSFLVRVSCQTYNQASYIEDAMNGFIIQKTTFPFVCTIVDDASTDGEPDIIKSYIERYFIFSETDSCIKETDDYRLYYARHKENSNCFFCVVLLKYNHYSFQKAKSPYFKEWTDTKYIATCEGDDYWTDPSKLQMQVDFMEANPEYGLCYTKVKRYNQSLNKFEKREWGGASETFDDLICENTIPTLTVLRKVEAMNKYFEIIKPSEKKWKMGDYPQWLWFSHEYKVKFIPVVTGVYRILENSASHFQNNKQGEDFIRSTHAMKSFYISYFNRQDLESRNDLNLGLFNYAIRSNNRERAISLFYNINKPKINTIIKYYIARIPILYKICKGRLFF